LIVYLGVCARARLAFLLRTSCVAPRAERNEWPSTLDRELDALLRLHPAEFADARDASAARLRSDGRALEASLIAGLKRPSAALWACNQLARRHSHDVEALIAKSLEWLRSGDDGDSDLDREVILGRIIHWRLIELTALARKILKEAKLATSEAVLKSVHLTLQVAAAESTVEHDALRRGVLRHRHVAWDHACRPPPTPRFPLQEILRPADSIATEVARSEAATVPDRRSKERLVASRAKKKKALADLRQRLAAKKRSVATLRAVQQRAQRTAARRHNATIHSERQALRAEQDLARAEQELAHLQVQLAAAGTTEHGSRRPAKPTEQ
jgi:hypothetical protein